MKLFGFVAGIMIRCHAGGTDGLFRLMVDWGTRCSIGYFLFLELNGDGFALTGSILR